VPEVAGQLGRGPATGDGPDRRIAAEGVRDRRFRRREGRIDGLAVRRIGAQAGVMEQVERAMDERADRAGLGFHRPLVGGLESEHVALEELVRALPPAFELRGRPAAQAAFGHELEEGARAPLVEGAFVAAAGAAPGRWLAAEEERPVALDHLEPGHACRAPPETPRGSVPHRRRLRLRGAPRATRSLVLERGEKRGGIVVLERTTEEQLIFGLPHPLREEERAFACRLGRAAEETPARQLVERPPLAVAEDLSRRVGPGQRASGQADHGGMSEPEPAGVARREERHAPPRSPQALTTVGDRVEKPAAVEPPTGGGAVPSADCLEAVPQVAERLRPRLPAGQLLFVGPHPRRH